MYISSLLTPKPALVLFDTGATWSYVSHKFCKDFQIELGKLDRPVTIDVAEEKVRVVERVHRGCTIDIFGVQFSINLIPVPMSGIDVVVGIDWMFLSRSTTEVAGQLVRIQNLSGGELIVYGKKPESLKHSGSIEGVPSGPGSRKLRCGSTTRNFSSIDFGDEIPLSPIRKLAH
ncbi:hypothetical protein OSB04_015194 [Centaurea solstitialis]|uniref:Uncharacterized protein n=1 Tax=Centaurea solstitialis TaxID=347529 RepID=A0AA38WIH7_9ASTR|nr:hypothetical protein OSB04_015194 [Centaurea solstitialis]